MQMRSLQALMANTSGEPFTLDSYIALKSSLAYNAISIAPSTVTVCLDAPKEEYVTVGY